MAVADTLGQWRSSTLAYLSTQVEAQIHVLEKRLRASGETLHAVAKQLNDDPNLALLGPLVSDGAKRVDAFAGSFGNRSAAQLRSDVETYARKQPLLAALAAAAVGFAVSRAFKASAKPSPT